MPLARGRASEGIEGTPRVYHKINESQLFTYELFEQSVKNPSIAAKLFVFRDLTSVEFMTFQSYALSLEAVSIVPTFHASRLAYQPVRNPVSTSL
jgi:hypothetical protein